MTELRQTSGHRVPARPRLPLRGAIASPARGPQPWSPAVQEWLDFLARLLADAATEEPTAIASEERRPS